MNPTMSLEPLSPAAFLVRAGVVHADRLAVVDGEERYTYAQFLDRALRLAGALRALGVSSGDRVAVLAPTPTCCSKHITACLSPARCSSRSARAPRGVFAAGNPCRLIRDITEQHTERL